MHKTGTEKQKSSEKNLKTKEEKRLEYISVHKIIKSLYRSSAVIMRNRLETQYPEVWSNTGNSVRSDEKRIKRILDRLVDFDIVSKEKIGKEQIYTYIHDEKSKIIHNIVNELNINLESLSSYYTRRNSIVSILNSVSDNYYIQNEQEDISSKEDLIIELETAIEKRHKIILTHKGSAYVTAPLKIAQFDGYWYIITYNTKYYKYRIKDISNVQILEEIYEKNIANSLHLEEWHNSWHTPNKKPTKITLFIDKTAFHYFKEKNILGVNTHANRLTPCNDGMEYEVYITQQWELLPTLMQWQKHVSVIHQEGEIDLIGIYRELLLNALDKLAK